MSEQFISAFQKAEERVSALEKIYDKQQSPKSPVQRVKQDLMQRGIYNTSFVTVPDNYYDLVLEKRAEIIGCSTNQLTKTLIFENQAFTEETFSREDFASFHYFAVVVQYCRKLDPERLKELIYSERNVALPSKITKKKIHLRLAPESVGCSLAGFVHNAVAPFGMKSSLPHLDSNEIPLIVCAHCMDAVNGYIYAGGGEVNVKLGMAAKDYITASATGGGVRAVSGPISSLRSGADADDED